MNEYPEEVIKYLDEEGTQHLIDVIKSKFDETNSNVDTNKRNISTNTQNISSIQSSLGDVQYTLGDHETRIWNLEQSTGGDSHVICTPEEWYEMDVQGQIEAGTVYLVKHNGEFPQVWLSDSPTDNRILNVTQWGVSPIKCATAPITAISDQEFKEKYYANVILPKTVTSIGKKAFWKNTMTAISLPEGLITIDEQAFQQCTNLTKITIPESLTTLGGYAFAFCTSLSTVEWNAKSISSASTCFNQTQSIRNITFGNKVQTIPAQLCQSQSLITSITIPSTVTTIGLFAFYNCTGLTSISYNGTMAQWADVTKGENWNYGVLATVVHCTDGDVNL